MRGWLPLAFWCALVCAPSLESQVGYAGRGPEFYLVDGARISHIDTRSSALLTRRIALSLKNATIPDALDAIGRQAGLRFSYTLDAIPTDARITLRAEEISVGSALGAVLMDLKLDIELTSTGLATVVAKHSPETFIPGRIAGRVTEVRAHTPIAQVIVRVDGTTLGTVTGNDGRYEIAKVTPGTYRVTARRLGFAPLTQEVTVVSDSITMADFALTAQPTKLDEIVTTALGDQRRYQIGNDIASINVDSLAPTTPVNSVTDLISARAPGVEVLESNGEAGNGPSLRIRGENSLVLQGDPIIIVDGVREDNTPGTTYFPLFGAVPSPSRINDIDFNDIESIDILKGPSAATEYGTDAANGVIVIKTKHSLAGAPRLNISAEQSSSTVGTSFPKTYYRYGHTPGPNPRPVQCPLVPSVNNNDLGSSAGTCVVDSVKQFTALNNSSTTLFGTGNREKLDASLAGGSDALRYYVAGGLTNETGDLDMPPMFRSLALSSGLPRSDWQPNGDDQRSGRANTVIRLTPTADLQVNAAYLSTNTTAPSSPNLWEQPYNYWPMNDSAAYYGWGYAVSTPAYEYGSTIASNTDRVTGSLSSTWTPFAWASVHATVGVDHGSTRLTGEIVPEAVAPFLSSVPSLAINNGTTDVYSGDLRATATASITPAVRSITSAGMQLADTRTQSTYSQSESITPTNQTLDGSTAITVQQFGTRQATLGGYLEEQLGLWERLFVTGAIRIDAGSGFGADYHSAAYPKASLSWLAVNGGPTSVRLRGAFGESGIQPPNGAAMQLLTPQTGFYNGAPVTTASITNILNANLQPERTAEFEGGTDLSFWRDRLTLGLTAYAKTTSNALVPTGTGWEVGGFSYYENVGEVTNTGFEGSVSATIIQSREFNWEIGFSGSINHNDLVKLAPGLIPQQLFGDHAVERFAPGTPLYGYAAPKATVNSNYHGGVVTLADIAIQDSLSYVGPSQPTRMASFSSHLGLWHGLLTVGGLFDYRGGFRLFDDTEFHSGAFVQTDRASNFAGQPVWEQVRDVASSYIYGTGADNREPTDGFYEDASYVRWRELSLTLALPGRWAHAARVKTLTLTGAIRNVMLWTPFTGGDPEVTSSEGGGFQLQPTSNTYLVNHDIRESGQPVPLSRYFVLRLNAGF